MSETGELGATGADASPRSRVWRGHVAAGAATMRAAARGYQEDRAKRLAAGLAYYSLFALVPALFTSMLIAAAIVGSEAARGGLAEGIEGAVGSQAAGQIEDAIAATWENTNASGFAVISALVVVYSASVLFVAWRDNLEVIWDVPYEPGLERSLRGRAFGALVPVLAGLLLSTILLVQMGMGYLNELVDSDLLDATLRAAGTIVPAIAAVAALGALYRHSTRLARPPWRDVWFGTLVASVGLGIAFWGYGLYLRFIGSNSVAGAASSVLVGLVLIYYASQILMFGAEVIKAAGDAEPEPDPTTVDLTTR